MGAGTSCFPVLVVVVVGVVVVVVNLWCSGSAYVAVWEARNSVMVKTLWVFEGVRWRVNSREAGRSDGVITLYTCGV